MRKVHGIGYTSDANDVGRNPRARKIWGNMLERVYAPPTQQVADNYKGVTVAAEWHDFSAFLPWYETNYIEGCFLDKDLKCPSSMVYSSDTCLFVSRWLNNILVDSKRSRGEYPVGVTLNCGKYKARISKYGKSRYLGIYATVAEASTAYSEAKIAYLQEVIDMGTYMHTEIKTTLESVIKELSQ